MTEKNNLVFLNTQTNSNLSFSIIKIEELVDFAINNDLNCLSISDFFPFKIRDFFNLCLKNNIKPVLGIKFFLKLNEDKEKKWGERVVVTVFPRNNIQYKNCLKTFFSYDESLNREFELNTVFKKLKDCLFVLEINSFEQLITLFNWTAVQDDNFSNILRDDNFFFGINFFIFSPFNIIKKDMQKKIIPFFSVKFLNLNDKKILNIFKKDVFSSRFFLEDKKSNFVSYLNKNDFFIVCTDDQDFYHILLEQLEGFISKIYLNVVNILKTKKIVQKKDKILELRQKCFNSLDFLATRDTNIEKEIYLNRNTYIPNYFTYFSW